MQHHHWKSFAPIFSFCSSHIIRYDWACCLFVSQSLPDYTIIEMESTSVAIWKCVCLICITRQLRACHKIHIIRCLHRLHGMGLKRALNQFFKFSFLCESTPIRIQTARGYRLCHKYYEFIAFLVANSGWPCTPVMNKRIIIAQPLAMPYATFDYPSTTGLNLMRGGRCHDHNATKIDISSISLHLQCADAPKMLGMCEWIYKIMSTTRQNVGGNEGHT